jgi:uncharacterized phage-associated protein
MLNVLDVANYIIALSLPEEGDILTTTKLHNLLYYCQGFYLAIHNKLLYINEIIKSNYGPVIIAICKKYKNTTIPEMPDNVKYSKFKNKQLELIKEVYTVYGQYATWKLNNTIKLEPPYMNTKVGEEIKHKQLKKYFKTQIEDE